MPKAITIAAFNPVNIVGAGVPKRIRRSDCAVQAVKVTIRSLDLKIDGMWCGVESANHLLDKGLCILIDGEHSGTHFASTYEVLWPGNPDDNSAPCMMTGGTDSPVVAMLMEQWVALCSPQPGTKFKVPSADAAREALPALRAARHARC